MRKQSEAFIKLATAKTNAEAVAATAEGEAKRIITEGQAQADMITAKGKAQAKADKAKGLADVDVLKAKKDAIGAELITAELNAAAIRDGNVTTLVIGSGGGTNGMPSVILPIPNTTTTPVVVPPTATPPAPTATP